MADITPWDEFERAMNELKEAMTEMRKAFLRRPKELGEPYIDIIDRGREIEVVADLPGVRKEDIDITIDGNLLKISAENKSGAEEKEENYIYRERTFKKFMRSITLPTEVDPEKAKSSFKDGILRIALPKKESRGKKIRIE